MKKIIFYLLYILVAKHLPGSGSVISFGSKQLRAFCAKGLLKKTGNNINIERGATFSTKVEINDNSGIGKDCLLTGPVIIGKNVMMAREVYIYTSNHEYKSLDKPMCEQGVTEVKPVIIEDDVWIGSRVTILPGVKIEKGSIIAAGAVVTKNVDEYSIVGGNPARKIKSRLDNKEEA